MTFKDIKKLFQLKSYSWLLNNSRPFIGRILGISALGVFIAAIGVGSVVVSKQMVDLAVEGSSQAVSYIILFVLIHLVILGANSLNSKISIQLYEKMSYKLEQDLLKQLYSSDWISYSKFHSGDILTRFTDDITSVTTLWVYTIPHVTALGLQLVLAFIVMLSYDPVLALIAFVLGPISILASFLIGLRLKKLQHAIQSAESRHRSFLTELIQNMMIVKSFQYEKESTKQIINRQNDKYGWVVKKNRLSITANLILSAGYWLGYVLAFIYGIFKLSKISFGTFTAFLQLVGQIQDPFIGVARSIPQMVSCLASVERLMELEALKDEQQDNRDMSISHSFNALTLDHVTFGYEPDKAILSDISLLIERGKTVALIGSSGEGKTTLMRLLLSLLNPDSGNIWFNISGEDPIQISPATRSLFTYVPQGNTLFSGTILDNLKVAKSKLTENDAQYALRAACAWDFIEGLPDKLDAVIGESGTGLSEGQAQRICIARALIRPAPIILLDEATSALDMDTERKIFENIRGMSKTCLVITHRLSVLPMCDSVYRLEKGKLHRHLTEDFTRLLVHEEEDREDRDHLEK